MSNTSVFKLEDSALSVQLDRLKGGELKRAMQPALTAGARVVAKVARGHFKKLVTKHNKGKGRLSKVVQVKSSRQNAQSTKGLVVFVNVFGDYRGRWFELGTKERRTKSRKVDRGERKGRHYKRRGRGGYRGRIMAGGYLERAVASTRHEVQNKIKETFENKVQQALSKK